MKIENFFGRGVKKGPEDPNYKPITPEQELTAEQAKAKRDEEETLKGVNKLREGANLPPLSGK